MLIDVGMTVLLAMVRGELRATIGHLGLGLQGHVQGEVPETGCQMKILVGLAAPEVSGTPGRVLLSVCCRSASCL